MATISCTAHIPGYTPAEVFEAGTHTETWPSPDGFIVEPQAERFAQGVIVRMGIAIPGCKFLIDGRVTEFELDERVRVAGRSRAGKILLGLDLSPDEDNGTNVAYSLGVNHSWATIAAEPFVTPFLKTQIPGYARQCVQNIVTFLESEPAAAYAVEL